MSRSVRLFSVSALAISGLVLAGCAQTGGGAGDPSDTPAGDRIAVVTSTNVYGDIVSAIGGDEVDVTAIITSAVQDPHSYEASAADQLVISKADLLIGNGGGYDAFFDGLAETANAEAPLLSAVEYSHDYPDATVEDHGADEDADHDHGAHEDSDEATGEATPEPTEAATEDEHADHDHTDHDHADEAHEHDHADETATEDEHADHDHADHDHADEISTDEAATDDEHAGHDHGDHEGHNHIEGFNEHVWYDPHTIAHLAEAIADELGELRPEAEATFTANLDAFLGGVDELETELAGIADAAAGAQVFVTEPVPLYLTAAAGLIDATPAKFSESVEEGQDVPPATLLEALDILASGDVRVVITNPQTAGPETEQALDAAADADLPVVEFTETLPEGQTYLRWMSQNVTALAEALGV